MKLGQRSTRPRRLIVEALAQATDFVSAREVFNAIEASGDDVSLASVYRTLRALAVSGEADAILRPDGETVYRICRREHHHHMLCRECGETIEITDAPMGTWAADFAAAHGFDHVSHSFEVFGRCTECRERSHK